MGPALLLSCCRAERLQVLDGASSIRCPVRVDPFQVVEVRFCKPSRLGSLGCATSLASGVAIQHDRIVTDSTGEQGAGRELAGPASHVPGITQERHIRSFLTSHCRFGVHVVRVNNSGREC